MSDNSVARFRAVDSDVDALRQHYAETLKPVRVDPLDGNRTISVHDLHFSMGGFDIWAGGCPSGMKVAFTEPPELYALYLPLSGGMEFKRAGKTIYSAPGTMFACDLASVDSVVLHGDRSHIGIGFDKKMATEHLARSSDHIHLRNIDVFDALDIGGDVEGLASMCKLVWQSLEAHPDENVRLKSNEMLLRTIMQKLFENLKNGELSTKRHSPAMPRHMKVAIDYMVANILMPIAIDDIAAAAGVSVRALQLAFQQFKDTTPLGYLRHLRMQHARAELTAKGGSELTIATIAKRWGFSNAARFSALYQRTFGETPKETRERQ